jgi:hypothetical protein
MPMPTADIPESNLCCQNSGFLSRPVLNELPACADDLRPLPSRPLLCFHHRPLHGVAASGRVEAVSGNAAVHLHHQDGARSENETNPGTISIWISQKYSLGSVLNSQTCARLTTTICVCHPNSPSQN